MANFKNYPIKAFSTDQKFLADDPNQVVRVTGQSLIEAAADATKNSGGLVSSINYIGELPLAGNLDAMAQKINITGYHQSSTVGGGVVSLGSGIHNGVTRFDPARAWPNWAAPAEVTAWFLNTGLTVPVWERTAKGKYSAYEAGAKFDGTTNDQLAILAAIEFSSRALLPVGTTNSETITLLEGQGLVGEFASIPSTGLGSILEYNGAGDAVHVEGTFSGFDSRRFMEFKDFSVNYLGTGTNSMYMEFLTIFNIENIICYGNPDYHLNMTSSYNGTIQRGRLDGAEIANLLYTVNPSNSVFSGQTLIEDFDFWSAANGTNDAAGTIVEAPANIMEQLVFNKCHWQSNDIGLWVKSGSGVTLEGAHFEGNLQNDVRVESGAQNPKILSGFCNNPSTTTESMSLDGLGGSVKSFKFTQLNNDAAAVRVGVNSIGAVIDDLSIRRNDGNICKGVIVEGQNVSISNVNGVIAGAISSFPLITLEATAKNVKISGITYDNFTGGSRIVDNGAENIIFEDARLVESPIFTLDGGAQEFAHYMDESGFVNRIWFVYPAGSGIGTTTAIQVGRSVSEGTVDYTRFANENSATSAGTFKRVNVTAINNPSIGQGEVLTIKTNGTSTTAGNVQIIVEITPYRALS